MSLSNAIGQDHNYAIGLTFQPSYYENYNKSYWNNKPFSYPDNPSSFNGVAIGLILTKYIANKVLLRTELAYSFQCQEYIGSHYYVEDIEGNLSYIYNKILRTEYDLVKLPVLTKLNFQLGYDSKYYINIVLGPQISFLANYKVVEDIFEVGFTNEINFNKKTFHNVDTPKNLFQKIWDGSIDPPSYRHRNVSRPYLYNRWLLGIVGEINFSKHVFSSYIISLGARYEYDFTSSEKYLKKTLLFNFSSTDASVNRNKSHNIRMGLDISIMYIISK